MYSVIAWKYPATDHVSRVNNYLNYVNYFNLENIKFPINIDGIKKFNEQNGNFVNVFEWTYNLKNSQSQKYFNDYEHTIKPLFICKNSPDACNLLVCTNGEKWHYVLCKNISIFLKQSASKKSLYPCLKCLNSFSSENKYKRHIENCNKEMTIELKFPEEDYFKFNKFGYQNRVPFTIYGDFETYNESCNGKYLSQLKPLCLGIYIKSEYEGLFNSQYIKFYGEDCIKKFVETIKQLNNTFQKLLKTKKEMIISGEEEEEFQNCNICCYCNKEIKKNKVRDHNHYNGKYRGTAHSKCSINEKKPNFVPVFFHNGSRFDNHLFFTELIKSFKGEKINLIPHSDENYISFTVGCMRFLDSYRFMSMSLDYLGSRLENEDIKICPKYSKGIFPYEYLTTTKELGFRRIEELLNETELPPIEKFYSTLKQKNIEEKEYEKAKND